MGRGKKGSEFGSMIAAVALDGRNKSKNHKIDDPDVQT